MARKKITMIALQVAMIPTWHCLPKGQPEEPTGSRVQMRVCAQRPTLSVRNKDLVLGKGKQLPGSDGPNLQYVIICSGNVQWEVKKMNTHSIYPHVLSKFEKGQRWTQGPHKPQSNIFLVSRCMPSIAPIGARMQWATMSVVHDVRSERESCLRKRTAVRDCSMR